AARCGLPRPWSYSPRNLTAPSTPSPTFSPASNAHPPLIPAHPPLIPAHPPLIPADPSDIFADPSLVPRHPSIVYPHSAAPRSRSTLDPSPVGRTLICSLIRRLSSPTWLTTPTSRPPALSAPSWSITVSRLSESKVPNPSSMKRVPKRIPPLAPLTTSASPSAKLNEV